MQSRPLPRQAPDPALRPSRRQRIRYRVGADVGVVLAAFAGCFLLYRWAIVAGLLDRGLPQALPYSLVAGLFAVTCVLVFGVMGLYRDRVSVLNLWELQTAMKGIGLTSALFFTGLFLFKVEGYSRLVVLTAIPLSTVGIIVVRRWLASRRHRRNPKAFPLERVLIVGGGEAADLIIKKIVQSAQVGWTVVGVVDDGNPVGSVRTCRVDSRGHWLFQAPVLGGVDDLFLIMAEHLPDRVIVVDPGLLYRTKTMSELVSRCRAGGVKIGVVPPVGGLRVDELRVEDVGAVPMLRPVEPREKRVYEGAKRALDLVLATTGLVLTAPVMALIAVAIKVDSPGPVFFKHQRVGIAGRPFTLWKFRTMPAHVDPYERSPSNDGDGRVSRVGRFLRVAGLDELPQLINVVRGDMSLVGPRPEMPFVVDGYGVSDRRRLTVRPGIAGIWQLSVDRDGAIHENLEYDLYYLYHRSLLLDAVVLVETGVFVASALTRPLLKRARRVWRPAKAVVAEPLH